jgi:hypothetical protein
VYSQRTTEQQNKRTTKQQNSRTAGRQAMDTLCLLHGHTATRTGGGQALDQHIAESDGGGNDSSLARQIALLHAS